MVLSRPWVAFAHMAMSPRAKTSVIQTDVSVRTAWIPMVDAASPQHSSHHDMHVFQQEGFASY